MASEKLRRPLADLNDPVRLAPGPSTSQAQTKDNFHLKSGPVLAKSRLKTPASALRKGRKTKGTPSSKRRSKSPALLKAGPPIRHRFREVKDTPRLVTKIPSLINKASNQSRQSSLLPNIVITNTDASPPPPRIYNQDGTGTSFYAEDIRRYLRMREKEAVYLSTFLENSGITPKMRYIVVEWLLQVQANFRRIVPDTYCLAIKILDHYLSIHRITPSKLQLLGATCLWIAVKFEDNVILNVYRLSTLSAGTYTANDILLMEQQIMSDRDLRLSSFAHPQLFLRHCLQVFPEVPDEFLHTCNYLLDVIQPSIRSCGVSSSLQAAAALYGAMLLTGQFEWTNACTYYAEYPLDSVKPTMKFMLQRLLKAARERKGAAAYVKYSSQSQFGVLSRKTFVSPDHIQTILKTM